MLAFIGASSQKTSSTKENPGVYLWKQALSATSPVWNAHQAKSSLQDPPEL
jgi:hypothetical protein